jgi:hypothetical protein
MADMTTQQKTERGLKYQIGRQAGMKRDALEESDYFRNKFFQTVKAAFDDDDTTIAVLNKIRDELWDWVQTKQPYTKANSFSWGKKTEIKPYEAKKSTFLAHFSVNGTYLGKVSDLGTVPIYYDGLFPISKEHFKVITTAPDARRLEDFFVVQKKKTKLIILPKKY